MSKDATIREIHHRVKNNLQTISSLLRLQGRRLSSPEAKAAIEESVRRIRSIALVHETLSHETGEEVPFLEIVRPLVRMVEEGLVSPDDPVLFKVTGDAGTLPAPLATPLAVVLTEALQNVVDHAYQGGCCRPVTAGRVRWWSIWPTTASSCGFEGDRRRPGPAAGVLDRHRDRDSGLSIVRTLVTTELAGSIELYAGDGPPGRPGTVVDIRVPLSDLRFPLTGEVPVVR